MVNFEIVVSNDFPEKKINSYYGIKSLVAAPDIFDDQGGHRTAISDQYQATAMNRNYGYRAWYVTRRSWRTLSQRGLMNNEWENAGRSGPVQMPTN